METNNSNVFFDEDTYQAMESEPLDLSSMTKAEVIPAASIMLRLEINSLGLSKKFAASEIADEEKDLDFSLINSSKRLVDKKFTDGITKLDSRMRAELYQIGMRPKFLGQGNVIVPLKLVHYTIKKIEAYKAERDVLIDGLIDVWAEAKEDAQTRNTDLYNEAEYPDPEAIREKFRVSYNLFSVGFPDVLERLEASTIEFMGDQASQALETQKRVQSQQLEEAVDEIKQGLRTGFYELVSNLEDKVRGVGTERKVFKPGFVSAFRTFLETFDAKNITNDTELSGMVSRCRAVMAGVSPDAIRNSLDVKVKLETELGAIKNSLASMVEPAKRAATFK